MSVTTLEEVFLRVGHGSEEVRALLLILVFTPQLLVPYMVHVAAMGTCCTVEGAYQVQYRPANKNKK